MSSPTSRALLYDGAPVEAVKVGTESVLTQVENPTSSASWRTSVLPIYPIRPAIPRLAPTAPEGRGSASLELVCVAEVCGVKIDDLERRRSVVLAILLGDSGAQTVRKMAERTGAHWGRQLVERVPLQTIRRINGVLGRNFVTKYGTRQGVIVLGRLAPFGIGAAIGGGANAMIGYGVVGATRRAFADDLAAGGTVE